MNRLSYMGPFAETKFFKYLTILLILVLAIIIFTKVFLETGFLILPPAEILTAPSTPIYVDWELLRKPLKVALPEIPVTVAAEPASTTPQGKISLTIDVSGSVQGDFIYKIDCEGDGRFEKITPETTTQKHYLAQDVCQYTQEGAYKPQVQVEAKISYYNGDEELTEIKKGSAGAEVLVVGAEPEPYLASCDVNFVEGTTQKGNSLNFTAEAANSKDQEVITYKWDFGDRVDVKEVQTVGTRNICEISHIYKKPGLYVPVVTMKDSKGREDVCVVAKLLGLQEWTFFKKMPNPASENIGREDPFMPVLPSNR
jgi:hypothetical protein